MDDHFYYLLCAAVAPVIACLGYIFAKDRYNKEPLSMLFGAFLCGLVSIIPICCVEIFLRSVLNAFSSQPSPLLYAFWQAFIVAACAEECFKMIFLHGFIWKSPEFDERFDGIVYGVFVSMGFACAENILYVFGNLAVGGVFAAYQTSVMRAIFSIPCHFFCGVILGYYLSLAKFENVNKTDVVARGNTIFKGLLYAIAFHGTYDFILFYNCALSKSAENNMDLSIENLPTLLLTVIFLIFNVLLWRFGNRRINHLANLLQRDPNDESSAFVTCPHCGAAYASDLNVCPGCKRPTDLNILAQNNSDNEWSNRDLHSINRFSSNHEDNRPPKNPFEL